MRRRSRRWLLLLSFLLRAVARASAADPDVVERASKQVAGFLEQMSDVKCTEEVTQLKLDKNGHTLYGERTSYDYLVLLQGTGDDFLLNESRLADAHNQQRNKKNVPLLITNGFSMLMLIFHPYYRNSFEFQAMPDEIVDGHRLAAVHFTHIAGTRTPAALAVRGREFPLDLTGTAWIDPDTGQVAKLKVGLVHDMSDVGLKSLTAEILYAPVQLSGWSTLVSLPHGCNGRGGNASPALAQRTPLHQLQAIHG